MKLPPRDISSVTPREREVWQLLASGLCNKEIADALGNRERTVQRLRESLYIKIRANNPVQATLLAICYGVVTVELNQPQQPAHAGS